MTTQEEKERLIDEFWNVYRETIIASDYDCKAFKISSDEAEEIRYQAYIQYEKKLSEIAAMK